MALAWPGLLDFLEEACQTHRDWPDMWALMDKHQCPYDIWLLVDRKVILCQLIKISGSKYAIGIVLKNTIKTQGFIGNKRLLKEMRKQTK